MLKKVKPGDPLAIDAATWNIIIDAANDFLARRHGQGLSLQPAFRQTGIIRVKNATGSDRNRFDIVGIDSPLFSPIENLDEFKNRVAVSGVTPAVPTHQGRFAVLLEPLAAGAVGPAVASGICLAKLNVSHENHDYAQVYPNQCGYLRSAYCGPVQVLWKEPGVTGSDPSQTKWAVVRLANPNDAAVFCLPVTDIPGKGWRPREDDSNYTLDCVYCEVMVAPGVAMMPGPSRNADGTYRTCVLWPDHAGYRPGWGLAPFAANGYYPSIYRLVRAIPMPSFSWSNSWQTVEGALHFVAGPGQFDPLSAVITEVQGIDIFRGKCTINYGGHLLTDQFFIYNAINANMGAATPKALWPAPAIDQAISVRGIDWYAGEIGPRIAIYETGTVGPNVRYDSSAKALGIPAGSAVANLTQTISNPPTQAEVQAIQSKLNELLDSLRAAKLIAT